MKRSHYNGRAFRTLARLRRAGPYAHTASFFSIVIGLSGFAGSWRAASQVWDLTPIPGEVLNGLAGVIWLFLGINYAVKWLFAHEKARAELDHPIQGLFVGLAGVATMLVALGGLPYSPVLATAVFIPGLLATLGFALWKTGKLWQGGRDPEQSIPALYLPLVAGSFVTAIALGSFGFDAFAKLAFGAGFFSWLAIDSVVLHRFLHAPELSHQLRPAFGVQLAPPAVGSVAYLSTGAVPDALLYGMLGYALLQAAILLRLIPWIAKHGVSISYWSFSFGTTALATGMVKTAGLTEDPSMEVLAMLVFGLTNMIMMIILVETIFLASTGTLLTGKTPKN